MKAMYHTTCGIDVHQHMLMCTVAKTEENKTKFFTREFGNFHKDFSKLNFWIKKFKVEKMVLESTGVYWNNFHDYFHEKGYEIDVTNAYHVKQVPGRKTDVSDSQWLAELCRYGLLKKSFVPSKEIRSLRHLTRYRIKTVNQITAEKNRMGKILESAGIRLTYAMSKIDCVSGMDMVKAIADGETSVKKLTSLARGSLRQKTEEFKYALSSKLSEKDRFVLKRILAKIEFLNKEVELYDKEIFFQMKPYKRQWHLIQTMPGIDDLGAALLLPEIGGDIKSFPNKEKFCSWMGLCPSNNRSAKKVKSTRTRKANGYVKTLVCELANSAIRTDSQFKGKYNTLTIRRGHKKSVVAIGHKMMEVVYSVIKNDKPYKDPKINYEEIMAKKNAPRWIRVLKTYNLL